MLLRKHCPAPYGVAYTIWLIHDHWYILHMEDAAWIILLYTSTSVQTPRPAGLYALHVKYINSLDTSNIPHMIIIHYKVAVKDVMCLSTKRRQPP